MFRVIAPYITDRGPPCTQGLYWRDICRYLSVCIWMHSVGTLEGDRGRSWNIWNDIWKHAHDSRLFRVWIHRFMKETPEIWWKDIQNDDPDTVMPLDFGYESMLGICFEFQVLCDVMTFLQTIHTSMFAGVFVASPIWNAGVPVDRSGNTISRDIWSFIPFMCW